MLSILFSFSYPLATKNRLSLVLFWSVPIGISRLPSSVIPSLEHMGQKETPGISPPYSWFPQVPRKSFLHLSEASYVCLIHNVQYF